MRVSAGDGWRPSKEDVERGATNSSGRCLSRNEARRFIVAAPPSRIALASTETDSLTPHASRTRVASLHACHVYMYVQENVGTLVRPNHYNYIPSFVTQGMQGSFALLVHVLAACVFL